MGSKSKSKKSRKTESNQQSVLQMMTDPQSFSQPQMMMMMPQQQQMLMPQQPMLMPQQLQPRSVEAEESKQTRNQAKIEREKKLGTQKRARQNTTKEHEEEFH